jgi:hypothetical protein
MNGSVSVLDNDDLISRSSANLDGPAGASVLGGSDAVAQSLGEEAEDREK